MKRRMAFPGYAWILASLCWGILCVPDVALAQRRMSSTQRFHVSSAQTRRAFRDVVAPARQSTVRLLTNDQPVALGVIVTADGLVITKASQVSKANWLELPNGARIPFKVLGTNQLNDLAVLKIEQTGLTVPQWNLESPVVGNWLATVGLDRDPVSIGVMSVARRAIPPSGEHGVLGIELVDPNAAKILRVFPNSGAELAGLNAGDVVLQIDSKGIASGEQLISTLHQYRPGDTLAMKIRRNDKEVDCSVTLTHPFGDFLSRIALQNQMGGSLSFRRDDFEAAYQTDSVVRPDECGGPVVDLNGKLVGINIARAGRTETYVLPGDLVLNAIKPFQTTGQPLPAVVTQ